MELVSPAGNFEKLHYAWEYGADAVYIGLKNFSLRAKADNFSGEEYGGISVLKKEYAQRGLPKKLYCAVNITFHNKDLKNFLAEAGYFKRYPFDAFIVQDLGIANILKEKFPQIPLHLSTQANCMNYEAVKTYCRLGFSRIVIGREASLEDISEIKQAVPEMEIECFVHGAMCISYSGRCLISAYLTGRSANAGSCTHSCRWNYKMFSNGGEPMQFSAEEEGRKGELFPVEQGENYTALFSSKDLCMIDYLDKLKKAGADSLKISGRMKSIYYTALTTRAYRKKIDLLNGKISGFEAQPFIDELYNTAHREFSTGFYFSKEDADKTTAGESLSPYILAGKIGKKLSQTEYEFISINKIDAGTPLEYVGPDICSIEDADYVLLDPETGGKMDWVCHGHPCIIKTEKPIAEKFLVRCKTVR